MDETARQLLKRVLKERGYSMTAARLFVGELLWDHEPQSMRELTQHLNGHIDRASLYRTVGLFEELGIAHRVYIGWKYKVELSDIFTQHHHHLSCLGCGKIVSLEDEQVERLIRNLAARHEFSVQHHQLEIQGYCAVCQARQSAG